MKLQSFKNKKVAILGFGIEGKDAYKFIKNQTGNITIFDRKDRKELDLSGVNLKYTKFVTGEDYLQNNLRDYDVLVRSPGLYRYTPELVRAEKSGSKVTSAIKIFFDNCPAKVIGVTGTKGKGTTSTLIYQILKKQGKDVYLAGNIGYPYLKLLGKLKKTSIVILELSSFQLIDLTKSPDIAVVLNITSDHMDWHKSIKEYVDAKKNIVKFQGKGDSGVINYDYETSKRFSKLTRARTYFFSKSKEVNGCYVKDGNILLNISDRETVIGGVDNLTLRGKHNWENINAAICASYLAGASVRSIKNVVFKFKGLEHRLEFVKTFDGVSYYNDSFATGPQPTIAAIKSFEQPLTLILGGYDKGLEYNELSREITKRKNIENVIIIGDIREKLQRSFKKAGYKGNITDLKYSKMDKIIKKAKNLTKNGGVVLLSPAAASFDMFENYKDRGEQFKNTVSSSEGN